MTDTKLTHDEFAEWLAVNVLKWTVERNRLGMSWWAGSGTFPGRPPFAVEGDFKPTTDLNHAKMVWDALTVEQQDKLLVSITANIVGDFRKLDYTRLACALRVVAETMQDPGKLSRAIYAVVKD